MSHLKERSEKNCLNCNAVVHGKYCHVCGQENLEPQETAWHLVTHFFNDITHFDGKFFSTLKYLILKPGFLSREYKIGRRASYLNPIRMYVFTSAIFFLLFFSVTHVSDDFIKTTFNNKTVDQIDKMDSLQFSKFTSAINDGKPMTRKEFKNYHDSLRQVNLSFSSRKYKTKAEYDSLDKNGKIHDNWLEKKLAYKGIEVRQKYKDNQGQLLNAFLSNLIHSFPQMLFISLPIFAFILKLLYIRRKQFYYASHAIFSIHLYVFVFIMLLLNIGFSQLSNYLDWSIFTWLTVLVFIYIFYYEYKAMRNFYQQRRAKTILKYVLLNISMLFVIILLFIIFTLFSIFKI